VCADITVRTDDILLLQDIKILSPDKQPIGREDSADSSEHACLWMGWLVREIRWLKANRKRKQASTGEEKNRPMMKRYTDDRLRSDASTELNIQRGENSLTEI
jgi:hypothetical protein